MVTPPTILVTGAAGFIGSALCRYLRKNNLARVVGFDAMTYAATRESLACLANDPDFTLIEADICDGTAVMKALSDHKPQGVMHLAAETHVDRSIDNPGKFVEANIVGTFSMLEISRCYLNGLPADEAAKFRFLHVSTDEVYGTLGEDGKFMETTPYAPNSPYAASKAGADHLVRAWFRTYKFPAVISNCSNNYGPYQFPEKLIPLCVMKALHGEKLPIYGKGLNVRDWLYVDDHADALYRIYSQGRLGEKYNVGGDAEWRNIDLVHEMCSILDELLPNSPHTPHKNLITFVTDRPGHDERYAMDFSKLQSELGWSPKATLRQGLRETIQWYLDNQEWCDNIRQRNQSGYGGERLGQIAKSA